MKISLRRKIVGSFVAVALLTGVASGISYSFLNKIDNSYSSLLDDNSAMLEKVGHVLALTHQQNSILFGYLVEPAPEKVTSLKSLNEQLAGEIKGLEGQVSTEEALSELQKMGESNQTFARLTQKVTEYADRGELGLAKSEALMWAVPTTQTLEQAAGRIQAQQQEMMAQRKADNSAVVAATETSLLIVSLFVLLFAITIGMLLSRSIVRPMRQMVQAAGRIADCDLTEGDLRIASRDEIGELAGAFNRMKGSLHEMVSRVGQSAQEVAAAAEELNGSSGQVGEALQQITEIVQDISAGAQQQVGSVQAGVGIIEGVSQQLGGIAGITEAADATSSEARQTAAAGDHAIRSAMGQMQSILSKMQELTTAVERLGGRSSQIMAANDLIAGIAQQTNMLALNASIEAARAGAAGRGFAVVADEVRKLSMQTTEAAGEIAQLIEGIRSETAAVVEGADAGTQEVSRGIRVVEEAGTAFRRIHEAVDDMARQMLRVSDETKAIAAESRSAVTTIHTVQEVAAAAAESTHSVSSHVEGQFASMEEIVSSSTMLSRMAEDLSDLIRKFRV
ncbi:MULTISPECIES: methyl-accepting chemotaxis protein [Paenibacillus]|uniref:methyl-accepting chemotaxis protein n=1 Tax=Paenibacillus TaxID=44249 RepID=UPI0022B883AA|nr:methyl-accepting chemotaxis protein [Paenibacillus caseinilyticus]MCZ8523160.1 methyl-accepting chemotaxis protein [Paenibacillus caseinilyticus]